MGRLEVVDLFCGAGGMTHGFQTEGLNVVAGIDLDDTCKYAYEKNNKAQFVQADVYKISGEAISKLYEKKSVKILIGCAPCQPFSTYNILKKRGKNWGLLYEFLRLVKEIKPTIVSMENVPQLKKSKVFTDFVKGLEEMKYQVSSSIVYCPAYGVPQKRRRLVLLASKYGKITLVKPTHKPSNYPAVVDAIGKLPPIKSGETCAVDPLHKARKLSDLNLKRIRITPVGGDWRDWPKNVRLKCHQKRSGKSFGRVYGRMRWDAQAPTMTTHCTGIGNGPFGHPEQDRAISFREAALIQTFPATYKFIDPDADFNAADISRQIGNAVPVRLGRIIARSIKKHVMVIDDARG